MSREQLTKFAHERLDSGLIYEPRGYFDRFELSDTSGEVSTNPNVGWFINSTPVYSNPEVFRNGENYPVTLTHAAFAVGYLDQADSVEDEQEIQRIGVRMRYEDEYYMNKLYFPCAIWGTKAAGAADVCSFGTSSWHFADGKYVEKNGGGCFILSARDTIQVDVQLIAVPAYTMSITVSFTGIGLLSQRSYFLTATLDRATAGTTTLIPNDLRNDGAEPILITDMVYNITGDGSAAATGDIRRLAVNVRRVGNGTNANWFHGPRFPIEIERCPASLLGITSGRAVIHEFPTPLVWEPGDGITMEAIGIAGWEVTLPNSYLYAGLFGYTMVR